MRPKPIVVVAVLAVLGGGGYFAYRATRPEMPKDALFASGTVEATDAQLGFQASGRITEVRVDEGDTVTAGAVLATLDRAEMEARREQAVAQIAAASAQLADLEAGARDEEIAEAQAAVDASQDRLDDARRDAERSNRLFAGGAVSKEVQDKAELGVQVASSQLQQAQERLRLLQAGPRAERVEGQRAQLAHAQASLKAIDALLENTTLTAPFAGTVTVRHREPGEVVAAGAPVVTLLDTDDRWVRIYVAEDKVGAVHLGAAATITTDTYPDRRYPGEVTYVSSEAEFTPKNVQTQEERVRLVYAVKVQVSDDPSQELKPGMPADVEVSLP